MKCETINISEVCDLINSGETSSTSRKKLEQANEFIRSQLTDEQQQFVFSDSPVVFSAPLTELPFAKTLIDSIKANGQEPNELVILHTQRHADYIKRLRETMTTQDLNLLSEKHQYYLSPIQ